MIWPNTFYPKRPANLRRLGRVTLGACGKLRLRLFAEVCLGAWAELCLSAVEKAAVPILQKRPFMSELLACVLGACPRLPRECRRGCGNRTVAAAAGVGLQVVRIDVKANCFRSAPEFRKASATENHCVLGLQLCGCDAPTTQSTAQIACHVIRTNLCQGGWQKCGNTDLSDEAATPANLQAKSTVT